MDITKDNYFEKLSAHWLELSKKWKFTYSSWADVWDALKKQVSDAQFTWIENENGTLWLVDDYWCFAKVRVWSESLWVDTTMYLHAMDFQNKAILKDKLTASEINKTYQRCMVKAIAVWFGLGLYIYKWEDLPSEEDGKQERVQEVKQEEKIGNTKQDDLLDAIKNADTIERLKILEPHIDTTCVSDRQKGFFKIQFQNKYKELNK